MKLSHFISCFPIFITLSGQAFGQASEAEVRAIDVSKVSFSYTKNWTTDSVTDRLPYVQEAENYIYAILPENPVPTPEGDTVKGFKYIRLNNVQGKKVYISPTWPEKTAGAIPKTATGDGCAHTHQSFGVWYRMPDVSAKWYYYGGGAMSGVRKTESGKCLLLVDNPLKTIDARYGWGKEVVEANFIGSTKRVDIAVGGYTNTHGWGNCTTSGFKACNERTYFLSYSIGN